VTDEIDRAAAQEPGLRILSRREPPASGANDAIVTGGAVVTAVSGVVFAVALLAGWSLVVYGSALATGLLALALTLRRFFTDRYPDVEAAEVRDPEEPVDEGPISSIEPMQRRTLLSRIVAGAAALFGLAVLAPPIASLGPAPGEALTRTLWREGTRLVDDDGISLSVDRLAVGGFANVWPEGAVGHEFSAAILLRLPERPEEPTNLAWVVDDAFVAYSKVCTHAGCPVSLFRERDRALFCPCHQSTFDAGRGARPTFGPTARALPQLPLGVDEDGVLVALGDFTEQVGPAFG
jgi:ubiquinol-cytochrome c reductase iron-sulfur subunit